MTQKELDAAYIALNAKMAAEKEAALNSNPRLTKRQRMDVLEGINRRYAIRKAKLRKEPIENNPDRKKIGELYRLRAHLQKAIADFRTDLWELDVPITFTCKDDKATFTIRIEEVPF